ncbi:Phosphoglycerate dehydrogenase [uncultured spirochete]|jgi:D-3-phosphoglycerate dehydrogenase|uniref:Phosphoglycerate dehydrogenase n=1 Tax=uncultured spirochete TaxID=156406 RepID=A0A3P3XIT5_9SPIR|nr:phosphoglycerate dehydrogenase [Rectinema subterraneum]SLM11996.1 Phosphoglycerate dehydrogenase [uncultured spirochete]
MFNIIVTARSFGQANPEPIRLLEENGCRIEKLNIMNPLSASELLALVAEADGIIAGLDQYDALVIENAKRLKVISRYGVGYDNVDLEAAKRKGVAVTFTPGTNENSVADLAMTLLLCASRNIVSMDKYVKSGLGSRVIGSEMWKKTLGIIGTGRIGKGLARRAVGFSMNILAYDAYPDTAFAQQVGLTYCSLDRLLRESDFISIHCPLTDETRSLIGAAEFAVMKPTAVLVNTARGGIVDEEALYNALVQKKIAAAALDVTVQDPPTGSPLLGLDNCIITPHIGGYTRDAVLNMGMLAARNLIAVLKGEPCEFRVV